MIILTEKNQTQGKIVEAMDFLVAKTNNVAYLAPRTVITAKENYGNFAVAWKLKVYRELIWLIEKLTQKLFHHEGDSSRRGSKR